jgi:quercetin dioxygenase-like cupin family protein
MKLLNVLAVTALLTFSSTILLADKPEKTQGLDVTPLQLHALAEQIPAMEGYELRTRRIAIMPGGTIAEHSHADRPGVVYVLEGSMTEHRGDTARIVKPGDTWTEAGDTVHWMENTSGKICIIVAVDLVPKKK